MPSFVIYQGEAGLRSENMRLKSRNAQLEAENKRLRELAGEAAVVTVEAEQLQQQRLGAPSAQGTSTDGNASFVIGPRQGAPVMNPLVARARGARGPQAGGPAPVATAPVDLPVSTQPTVAEEENQPSTRFQLIELHK